MKKAAGTSKAAKQRRKRGSAAVEAPEVRRRPMQERSLRRLEAIVEAAASSFAEIGYGDTTMEGIAARADTSIGSVYQFFPNKRSLFREIANRCIALVRRSYAEFAGPDPAAVEWPELLERFIDGFMRLHERSTIMQAIWRNLELYGEFAEADQALLRELETATAGLLGAWLPALPLDRRRVIASVLVNTVSSMVLVIVREHSANRRTALVGETKRMLRGYLAGYLE